MSHASYLTWVACCLVHVPGNAVPSDHTAPGVLLANVYDSDEIDLAGYWVSEKYDGVRGWWDGRKLVTRTGQVIRAPAWFTEGWPDAPLDGELWIGRGQFEALNGVVLSQVPDDAAWRRITFMVFDLPAYPGTFDVRYDELRALVQTLAIPWMQAVAQFKVSDEPALQTRLQQIVSSGGEGLMLHRGASLYNAGRSNDLIKLKRHEDAEAQVIGYSPGTGKYTGMMGALRVRLPDGQEFKLGTGFSDAQRRTPPPIGSWVTYAYQGLTERGIPRFARFLRVQARAQSSQADPNLKQRLGPPATRAVAQGKKRGFSPSLATCGGGAHLPHRDVQMP